MPTSSSTSSPATTVADAIRQVAEERREKEALPPFEVYVRDYLRKLLETCGYEGPFRDEEVDALHVFIERRFGSRYPTALFEAPSLAKRGEIAAREAYARGLLQCTATADGFRVVEAFAKASGSRRS